MSQRRRIAHKLQNPRIDKISFHTLRHLYGLLEYFKTKAILPVKADVMQAIFNTTVYTPIEL